MLMDGCEACFKVPPPPKLRAAPLGSSRPPRNAAGRASTHLAITPWRARRESVRRDLWFMRAVPGLGRQAGTIVSTDSPARRSFHANLLDFDDHRRARR